MSRIVIRKVGTPNHLPDDKRAILDEFDKDMFEDIYPREDNYWWVAYYQGQPVGFAGLDTYYTTTVNSAFLSRVGVIKPFRGLGLQKRFIKVREKTAREDGFGRIVTYVAPYNIHSANNLIDMGYRLYDAKYEWGVKNALYFEKLL